MLKYNDIKSVTEIPYFEGDHWPDALENFLAEVKKPGRQSGRSQETQKAVQNEDLLRKVKGYFNGHSKVKML